MNIGFVSTLQPETHYSRFLLAQLFKGLKRDERLFIYAEIDKKNQELSASWKGNLRLVFNQDKRFPQQVSQAALVDKIDLIHIQHEVNMFGGAKTAYLFPGFLRKLKAAGLKVAVTFHGVVGQDQIDVDFLRTFSFPPRSFLVKPVKMFFKYLFGRSGRFIDLALCHSEFTRRILIKDYGNKPSQVQVVRLGVADGKLKTSEFENLEGKKFALYFGYILKRKGLEYLIEAWKGVLRKHPDWHLVLAGGYLDYQKDYADGLKAKALAELKNKIVFTGFLQEKELFWLYKSCQFVVLPYTLSISSSLPLSFAIQYQKPVIATSIGTLKEEIKDGQTGLLVQPASSQALERAINQLIDKPVLLQKLARGQALELKERSWHNVAQNTLRLYRQLAEEK